MAKSLNEEWVKQVTAHFVGAVIPARDIREKLVSNYYKTLVDRMDTDHNGRLSVDEILRAMTYLELDIQYIAARLVIKHDSEWYGGSQHQKWEKVLKNCDSLRVKYVNKWLGSMEWMSHVPPFDKGEPIWHMHSVIFLDALINKSTHKRRDHDLGTLTSKYETGGRGSQTVSGGEGDAGGVSYGLYQMTSKTIQKINGKLQSIIGGTVKKFVSDDSFKWKDEFRGLLPGTSEFTSKWKEVVNNNPVEFRNIEHEFIKKTHFDIFIQHILPGTGVDIRYHSHALNDVVWSTAVQHGPKNDIIINAIRPVGGESSETKVYDELLIREIYNERGRKDADEILVYFSKNSIAIQKGVSERFIRESKEALERLHNETDY